MFVSYFYHSRSIFERSLIFGDNKNKLALLLFNDKIVNTQTGSLDEPGVQKKITIEMTEETLIALELVYDDIQSVKKRHDFTNLSLFLDRLCTSVSLIENADNIPASELSKVLSLGQMASFFTQTDKMAKFNMLNYRDDVFVVKFAEIVAVC